MNATDLLQVDRRVPLDFMARRYGRLAGHHHLVIWDRQTKQSRAISVSRLDEVVDELLTRGAEVDAYFGWSTQPGDLGPRSRGRNATALGSPGVMIDVDFKGEAHKNEALPCSEAEVFDWLQEIGAPKPTEARLSGNGMYLDWLHPEPVVFANDNERNDYAAKVQAFHRALRTLATQRRGWKLDSTHDLARVTRMPGTFNHKTNPPKFVELINV